MALPLALALAPSLVKGVAGFNQMRSGQNILDGLERPEYEIPSELMEGLAISRAAVADTGYAGMSGDIDLAMLSANQAAQRAIESGNAGSSAAIVQAAMNRDLGRITQAKQRQQERDLDALRMSQRLMADGRDKKYQEDFDAFADEFQRGQDMFGAGAKNLFGGLDSAASLLSLSSMGGGDSLGKGLMSGIKKGK